jgi:hypothetical protein
VTFNRWKRGLKEGSVLPSPFFLPAGGKGIEIAKKNNILDTTEPQI